MRLIPTSLMLLTLLGSSCDSGTFQGGLPPCPCDNGGCSDEACPIEVGIDANCVGQFDLAEVLIGTHVEALQVRPSERSSMCSAIEPGASVTIHVRGGDWAWGPLEEKCETPREKRLVLLQCVESP